MEIIIIIILILLNGLFSMSEMAVVSSKKFKLELEKKKGNSGAKKALDLAEDPNKFLSTVQIGITLIGILLGVYSGDRLTVDLALQIERISFLAPYASSIAPILMVIIITYFSIVFGELIPKRFGLLFPESISSKIARPMSLLSKITSPFVWLLTVSNNLILKILGIKEEADEIISEEEIKSIIKESTEGGEIQEKEHEIVERVFELGDRRVNTLATHRSDVIFLNIEDDYETLKTKIKKNKFSGYPIVSNNNLDEVVGILLLKDLFGTPKEDFKLKAHMRKPLFVNENSFAYPLLERMQKSHAQLAIMIDEYGTTAGIVTFNDIMDELIGESPENDDEDFEIIELEDGSWIIDGQYSIYEFEKFFEIDIKDQIEDLYVTVAGLFLNQSDDLPKHGDKLIVDYLELQIIEIKGNRIEKISAKALTKEDESIVEAMD